MPDGRKANSNSAAKDYYHKLIDLLIENDIEPHVTLYHWDLPSALYTEKCPGKLFDYLFSHGQSQSGFEITKNIVHEFVHEKNRARFHDSCTIKFFRARFFSCTIF